VSATAERRRPATGSVDHRIRIEAPPARVWRALVDLDDLRRWMFASMRVDVRIGGFWRFTFPTWPSARGLVHPALEMGGPIVALAPERELAVEFASPYWGVLRFALEADGAATRLRVTQDGFEGNEQWLADFRGGWASFADRLAVLCEAEAVAAPRRLSTVRGSIAQVDPSEVAATLAAHAPRAARDWAPFWTADAPLAEAGRAAVVVPGMAPATPFAPGGMEGCDALCAILPPGIEAATGLASLERSLGRRGWRLAGPRLVALRELAPPVIELQLPYAPAFDPRTPEPFVRAFERAFCAPGRETAPAYFAPDTPASLHLAGGPYPRPLAIPLQRLPARAVARFDDLAVGPDGRLRASWQGAGWTAGRNRGTSEWSFSGDGRIAQLVLRWDPS
jgi:uncharacterized protein YndB with AHSA1/START domain